MARSGVSALLGVNSNLNKSYLSNRNHYVSINGYDSSFAAINCGIPQLFVLGQLLFSLYRNELNKAIKSCKVHLFAKDTNLLCLSNSN